MAIIGYQLLNDKFDVVKEWNGPPMPPFPNPLVLPDGTIVTAPEIGEVYNGYSLRFLEGACEEPIPDSISRRQCALQLLEENMISGYEAVAMVRSGTPPNLIDQYFQTLPENLRFLAEIDFAADTYLRGNELLRMLAASREVAVDDFFRKAAKK